MTDLKNKRVVVMGLGRFGGGVGVTQYLAREGADVLVTDLLPEADLVDSLARLKGLPVRYRLGAHDEADFAAADLVVVNPAVDPRHNKYLQAAVAKGAVLTAEIKLLIDELNPARIIGVTGTAGKSTTTSMIGHALQHTVADRRVHVGGNIGGSLLGELDAIGHDDWVVLELSSFMLEMLDDFSPHIAVVTNLADNHLDRHETMENYARAKQTLVRHQKPGDVAILGDSVRSWASMTAGRSLIVDRPLDLPLLIPGAHNRLNAAMALAACTAAGIDPESTKQSLRGFTGLPHRLQRVVEWRGVAVFNDSKSTTPDAAKLALDAFDSGVAHVILGGYDKHADLKELAHYAARKAAAIYTIGATGPAIAAAAQEAGGCEVVTCGDLTAAVHRAMERAQPGQVVLLSPACASWDQFTNFEQRAAVFTDAVNQFLNERR